VRGGIGGVLAKRLTKNWYNKVASPRRRAKTKKIRIRDVGAIVNDAYVRVEEELNDWEWLLPAQGVAGTTRQYSQTKGKNYVIRAQEQERTLEEKTLGAPHIMTSEPRKTRTAG